MRRSENYSRCGSAVTISCICLSWSGNADRDCRLQNLNQNPRTLLPKFFGLYCYQCNSKNIRLVVMNNLLPSSVKMHQRYDLKGSTYKRKVRSYTALRVAPCS